MRTLTTWIASTLLVLLCTAWLPASTQAQGRATLTGTVVDATDGTTLVGANVALREVDSPDILRGTATDPDGTFQITDITPGSYVVEVRFIGYQPQQRTITLEAGESRDITVELPQQTSTLDQVVVSASRRQEKVLDAPASISVIEPVEIESEVATSTVEIIRATPGVDMAQTGIDRREVVLRGFNEAFSGSAFVLTDYRQAAVPSLGVNVHSIMPNMAIDVERIEVVRGPGSALYGPGVDSGVIHYFTKDPFEYPGTSVSVSGGSRAFFSGQFRQAGVLGDNLGYKVTGQFARADEWDLDLDDPDAQREVNRYRVYDSRAEVPDDRTVASGDFDDDGDEEFQLRREDLYSKFNVNGLLQYRTDGGTTVSLNGGHARLTSTVQSGIGTLQADGFGYSYGQLRLQSGGLFAQAFVNVNDSGEDTYVYGSGDNIRDKGIQWNAQTQYDFNLDPIGTQVIAGLDADITIPRTQGRILGRNEDNDRIEEYGGYAQTTTDLSEQFTLTLASRLDWNNVVDEFQVSPRAALVFKPTPTNTLRASFNRSFSSPGTNSLFLDIEALRQPLPGGNALVFQGLGAADGYTFNNFRQTGTASGLLPTIFNQPIPTGQVPLQPIFGTVVGGLAQAVQMGNFSQLPEPLRGLPPEQLSFLVSQLQQLAGALSPQQFTTPGQLGIPDDSEQGFNPVDGPTDIAPLDQTTTLTYEVGYKGVIADRVIVQVDGYYEQKEDFIGPLVTESPLLYVNPQDVNTDLQSALAPLLQGAAQNDPRVAAILNQFGGAQQAAGFLAGVTSQQIGQGPVGVVQPDQDVLPGDNPNEVGGFLSYRNFGQVQYWGIDASVEVQATDALRLHANTSIVSDDFFDNEELDEEGTDLSLALNAPSFKVKGGFDYRLENGFSFGLGGNYVEGFPVETGPYVGEVDPYFTLDARLGYDVPSIPGLRINITGKNILNNEHREFAGAPELGTLILGRATYTLQ
jgi:iron complex outermembrane receptor protein